MYRLPMTITLCMVCNFCFASPPGGPPRLPKANAEAERKLKEAYACYVQGWYERAIDIANEVYSKYGDVQAKWFPSWMKRVVKGKMPNPYDKGEVLGRTLEGQFLFTMTIKGAFPSYLLARSYAALGEKEQALFWSKKLIELGYSLDVPLGPHPSLPRIGIRPKVWRPLPLRYLEEDYFILVPLDDACKVLGLGCFITPNPKIGGGKSIRVTKPDLPDIVYRLFLGHPLAERLEKGKGQTETLAYAPFEEDGKLWVPFYWLAKQAGIRGWEVRNGKIYVAPKQGTR
ncbi:MAG: hypothetical protein RMK94_00730 [Armatimonadota bacterium]|nr:hypothetical protein [Armatimonadota bacterium]